MFDFSKTMNWKASSVQSLLCISPRSLTFLIIRLIIRKQRIGSYKATINMHRRKLHTIEMHRRKFAIPYSDHHKLWNENCFRLETWAGNNKGIESSPSSLTSLASNARRVNRREIFRDLMSARKTKVRKLALQEERQTNEKRAKLLFCIRENNNTNLQCTTV